MSKRRTHRIEHTPTTARTANALSLPPAPAGAAQGAPSQPSGRGRASGRGISLKKRALAIMGMRHAGYTNEEIAREMGIKRESVNSYIWKANKEGLFKDAQGNSLLTNPFERIEVDLAQKVVENFADMLSSDAVLERGQKSVKMEATFELARGALFKKYDAPAPEASKNNNILMVKFELPEGTSLPAVRHDSVGGEPNYVDADVEKAG